MKVKLVDGPDGKKYAAVDDNGLPIYVHNDGREIGFDAVAATNRISALNKEAQTHREAFEGLQGKVKAFEGIEDPEAARNALQTVSNLRAGELKTAAQVAEIQAEAKKAAEAQVEAQARQMATKLKELESERDTFRTQLYDEKVGGAFSRSKFVGEKTVVPPDMLQAMFGRNFKVEDGKLVPYGLDGNKLYSRVRPGELADFEEGMEILIESYPHKNTILKGTGNSGSGASHGGGNPGGGGQQGGKPTLSRSAFEKLPVTERQAALKTHTLVNDEAA